VAERRHVFLYGVPRSGTTWLQNMLGSRPEIVTPQETGLLTSYLGPVNHAWQIDLPDDEATWAARRHKGLPALLTQDEFDSLLREVVDRVYGRAWELKPSAFVVLDKDPGYSFVRGFAERLIPDARFVQLIRDGRDVTASLARASQGFGRGWAPDRVDYAAWLWDTNVRAGRQYPDDAYHEVRYEDLRGNEGPAGLRAVFEFCGVGVSDAECGRILETFSLAGTHGSPPSSIAWGGEVRRRVGHEPREPSDFFGEGTMGGWTELFGPYKRWLFDRYAGELLVELGYERDRSWAACRPAEGALYHARFAVGRWRPLIVKELGKVRRNLRPRQYALPAQAILSSRGDAPREAA
jgi:hypothetical protein